MTENCENLRPVWLYPAIIGTAAAYAILLGVLLFPWSRPATTLLPLPWFIPLIGSFQALIHFCVAFLAIGRCNVLRDPASFWIGMGSASFSMALAFYSLTWPGLLPNGGSIIASLPGTPAWFLQIGLTAFSAFLLIAALVRRPAFEKSTGGQLLLLATGWVVFLTLAFFLILRAEQFLPVLVTKTGVFTAPLLSWNGLLAVFFSGGAVLSTRRYLRTGDALLGYIAFAQVGFAFAILATVSGMRRYDLWWYLLRAILTGSGLIVLFGLLSEYVQLFRRERDKTEQLKIAKIAADEASRAKDTFLINMSHELRTPLTVNMGMLDLAKTSGGCDEQTLRFLDNASASAESLLHLIDNILELRNLQEKTLPIAEEPFNLIDCCRDALSQFTTPAEKKGLRCTVDLDSHLPHRVIGDCAKVKEVLFHLIGNAVKFTEKGEIEFSARPGGRSVDGQENIRFEIRDTGIGIPTEKLQLIFQPFSQADASLTRRYGGAGLGLAISRELIEQMGGKLEVQSAPERGSTFSFMLPFAPVAEESEQEPIHLEKSKRAPGQGARILVVEDDPHVAHMLQLLLTRSGYTVRMAEHGRRALEVLEEEPVDLILMDLKMPVMDGYEATRAIRRREQWRQIPIIALTAHARPEDKANCLAAGMCDFLSKPINVQRLYTAIEEHLPPKPAAGS